MLKETIEGEYNYGFTTNIGADSFLPGISKHVIFSISYLKKEPSWLLAWRLKSYNYWITFKNEPEWAQVNYSKIDYRKIICYSSPRFKKKLNTLNEVDPELLKTYNKLGISLNEQKRLSNVAVDAVFDSVSVATTFKDKLFAVGVVFCSLSDAIKNYPELVKRFLGTVVPFADNFFSCLNSAVFSDGSFCYVPKNVKCPMELSTYFRINTANSGQFERTLIIAEEQSSLSYLEGCTAPIRDENQLHAAVVELIAFDFAEIKYSTVQNWYPGDKDGKGGVYNFVTKRGICRGYKSKISWIQVEAGSAITWKYPSVLLHGDESTGEFYSVATTGNFQQADTGTKMIHIGKNTKSTIISKGISVGRSSNSYRGLVRILRGAISSRNYSQCDSLILGNKSSANTFPYIDVENNLANVEHEAVTSNLSEQQLFYCFQRGISEEDAVNLIVSGFCKSVFQKLPMEFAVEARKLLAMRLEGAIG